MPKFRSIYICQQCGFRSSQFLGKCPECGSWNSLVETVEENRLQPGEYSKKGRRQELPKIINLSSVEQQKYERLGTGLEEFDRVLGGGIVLGSVVLVSGDPGIGKSTLLTQLALNLHGPNKTNTPDLSNVLYVAGEESAHQIKIRAERITPGANLAVLNETDVDNIAVTIEDMYTGSGSQTTSGMARLVVVDSIQTLETSGLNSVAGSVGQVRECAHRLQKVAKALHIPIFLVGHVTKEGTIAGPKTLEHLVDVVLSLEGDPNSNFRILRATKNRFGPTDEVGIFEMEETGLVEVKNPSKLFLQTASTDIPGSVVVATLNGLRPILVEIQALVTKSFLPQPRRVGLGIDNNRLQLLAAVLQSRMKLPLFDQDIFINVTGGLKVTEPAADLGICMAIVSSLRDKTISPQTVILGEVGLLGEIRQVRGLDKRVKEAKKLGFKKIISSENARFLKEAVVSSLG